MLGYGGRNVECLGKIKLPTNRRESLRGARASLVCENEKPTETLIGRLDNAPLVHDKVSIPL